MTAGDKPAAAAATGSVHASADARRQAGTSAAAAAAERARIAAEAAQAERDRALAEREKMGGLLNAASILIGAAGVAFGVAAVAVTIVGTGGAMLPVYLAAGGMAASGLGMLTTQYAYDQRLSSRASYELGMGLGLVGFSVSAFGLVGALAPGLVPEGVSVAVDMQGVVFGVGSTMLSVGEALSN